VNFFEEPPSKQWLPLKYRGEKFAEVWFKPEGEPFGLIFRIPQLSFYIPGIEQELTIENLLRAIGIATEGVESWRHGDIPYASMKGSNPELRLSLISPSPEVSHLDIHVSMKPPAEVAVPDKSDAEIPSLKPPTEVAVPDNSGGTDIPSPKWQDVEARWNAILGVEAGIDTLRQTLESVRAELEASWSKTLTPEEKLNALRADLAQWTKAKNRIHHVLPKVREFVHRATWAMGTPERKKLGEFFETHAGPDVPATEIGGVPDELESLLKDRQILSAQGVAVHQECKNVSAEIQGALRILQSNAAVNARRKREAGRAGGKFFKDVRRWTVGGG
jgi:hypothetical protein